MTKSGLRAHTDVHSRTLRHVGNMSLWSVLRTFAAGTPVTDAEHTALWTSHHPPRSKEASGKPAIVTRFQVLSVLTVDGEILL